MQIRPRPAIEGCLILGPELPPPPTRAPSIYRALRLSLPVPPPAKTDTPPVTPAPLRPRSETRQIQPPAVSALSVVISDQNAPSYHEDIVRVPGTPPPGGAVKCLHFFRCAPPVCTLEFLAGHIAGCYSYSELA